MRKFTLFRTVCRIAGILSCVAALIGLNLHSTVLVLISVAVLAADLILIAWKKPLSLLQAGIADRAHTI